MRCLFGSARHRFFSVYGHKRRFFAVDRVVWTAAGTFAPLTLLCISSVGLVVVVHCVGLVVAVVVQCWSGDGCPGCWSDGCCPSCWSGGGLISQSDGSRRQSSSISLYEGHRHGH